MGRDSIRFRFPKWITRDRACGQVVYVSLDVAGLISVRYNLVNEDYQDMYGRYRLDERTVPKRYKNLVMK